MNKIDFLRKLNRALAGLDPNERKEILDFYEERFYSGTFYENKTEAEVISELESPDVIARNVLSEYGMNPKYIASHPEKTNYISGFQVTMLVIFDLLVTSWLLVTLASVTFSMFVTVLTYFTTFAFLVGDYGSSGVPLFFMATGIYIFVFLFALFLLDLTVAITKNIFLMHLKVFKFKNRAKIAKCFNKKSVDGWFKKHRKFNSLRKILFVLGLVFVLYSGYELFSGNPSVIDEYQNRTVETAVYTFDAETDITENNAWTLSTDFGSMDIEVTEIEGNEITVTHKYYELDGFEVTFNEETNTISVINDTSNNFFGIFIDLDFLSMIFNNDDGVVIGIPKDLIIEEMYVENGNGRIDLTDIEATKITVINSNGTIDLNGIITETDLFVKTVNGSIVLNDIVGEVMVEASTSNGSIIVYNVNFTIAEFHTTNGNIVVDDAGALGNGVLLIAQTTNGDIELENVYYKEVTLVTTNGDIDFYNTNLDYVFDSISHSYTNGNYRTNIQ